MSSAEGEDETQLRHRPPLKEEEEKEEGVEVEKEIEAVLIENNESDLKLKNSDSEEESGETVEDEKETETLINETFAETTNEKITHVIDPVTDAETENVRIYRGPRNVQSIPVQRSSFIGRQLNSIKCFFLELIDFILLL